MTVITNPRQIEIIRCIAEGKTIKEIQADLKLAKGTVDYHITQIHKRLRVSSIALVTRYAIRAGIVSDHIDYQI